LAERWNGKKWTIQHTPPNLPGTYDTLSDVSCASRNYCIAVGTADSLRGGDEPPLVERWNGTKWTIQKAPTPAAAPGGLDAVSCISVSACTAVGSRLNSTRTTGLTFAERWNGTEWSIQKTPTPADSVSNEGGPALIDVSCHSANACVAVGDYETSTGRFMPLVERWNGTEWSIQKSPKPPAGAKYNGLSGVSCTSATACTAVGGFDNGMAVAERWNGTEWVLQKTPSASGRSLFKVSCTSAHACTAVGIHRIATLVEHWNGTKWVTQRTPNVARELGPTLRDVSCISARVCTAVGDYYNSADVERTLAEHRS
jgi:hypothetical protein